MLFLTLSYIFFNFYDGSFFIKSIAWRQCNNYIPTIYPIFYRTYRLFRAAYPPIETWSYWLAEVAIESVDAGCINTFDYDNSAAEVSILFIKYIELS